MRAKTGSRRPYSHLPILPDSEVASSLAGGPDLEVMESDVEILDEAEAARRKSLLGGLYEALTEAGIECVPTSRYRLALEKMTDEGPLPPSGHKNPELRVFLTPGRLGCVTTDGSYFLLESGPKVRIANLPGVVVAIRRLQLSEAVIS